MKAAAIRPVTIRDVAREANVSVASASRAMNGLDSVTESTRERVLGAARSLRYVPHSGARSLITRRTDTIGVVLPELYGEFFSEVIRGADLAAHARGLHLLVSTSHGRPEEAAAAIRSMRGRVDGLLIMSPHVDADILAENLSDGLPTVLMNTRVEAKRYPSFQVDNYGGAQLVVRHLLQQGRRRIAHVAGPDVNFEAAERRRGFLAAVEECPGAEPIVLDGDFFKESGHAAGVRLAALPSPPDAVFAANDMMAFGCMTALIEAGLRVPEDVAVAGFDDIPLAQIVRPALTTARVRICDLGRSALERLVAGIEGAIEDEDEMLQIVRPELVVRESTRSIKAAPAGPGPAQYPGRNPS
jgi:LacI family transcriptional regulator